MRGEKERELSSLDEVPAEYRGRMLMSGIDLSEKERSGSFLQKDRNILFSRAKLLGLEVMSIEDALEKYELEDYSWKAVSSDVDGYTRATERNPTHGVFIRKGEAACEDLLYRSSLLFHSERAEHSKSP